MIPHCIPVMEMALAPRSWIAMERSAMEICSPVESSMSISRREGLRVMALAKLTSRSVVWPMAETTTAMWAPPALVFRIRSATLLILWILPTEVPPYF